MIDIVILALKNAVPASITDARYAFHKVNEFLEQSGKAPVFRVRLAGVAEEVKLAGGVFSIRPDVLLPKVHHTDLIIIPAMTGDMLSGTFVNSEYAAWIAARYKNGTEVASFCVGAFLLAFSGVLKGRQCTTHWQYANEFRAHYPNVKLVDEQIITNQNGLYSSGGSTSYWSLLLHLVEKFTDREMAIQVSKYFVVDFARSSQAPFAVFSGIKDHEDPLIAEAQQYIEQNYTEKLTVDTLAELLCSSRRTFERRFRKATSITVVEYIQRVKIEAAKKELETGRKTVNEIMYEVGYSDRKAFRDLFRKITGMLPIDYRDKYNKEAV